jgi:uncharacterized membrane protein
MMPPVKKGSFLYVQAGILLAFGCAYAFLIPLFEAPDEPAHFLRAYGIAEGQFILHDHPRALVLFLERNMERRHKHQRLAVVEEMKSLLAQHEGRIPNIAFNTSQYSPVPYLFHAAVIKIVLMLDHSPRGLVLSVYAARLATVFLYVAFLFLAFRMLPAASWPVFWIAVTPMALSQAGVVSEDYIVFCASVMLLFASLKNLPPLAYALYVIPSTFFLLLTKAPYAPLLLVPAVSIFVSNPDRRAMRVLSLVCALALALAGVVAWNALARSQGILDLTLEGIRKYVSPNIDPVGQLHWIVRFPLQFLKVVLNTLRQDGLSLYHQVVGVLGWLDTPIPLWTAVLWGLFSVPAILVSKGPDSLNRARASILGAACIVGSILALVSVFATIYAIWMPVGAQTINLQGRYFHPVLVALLVGVVLIKPKEMLSRHGPPLEISILGMATVINAACVVTLVEKYWN